MNLKFRGNDFIVFFNKLESSNINFKNSRDLELYFKKFFLKIKKLYDIDVSGSYDITVYVDDDFGILLDVIKEDSSFYDDTVDMKIIVSSYNKFVYKINRDIPFDCNYYLYHDCLYARPKNPIDFIKQGILFENCEIVYGEEANDIIYNGFIVDNLF